MPQMAGGATLVHYVCKMPRCQESTITVRQQAATFRAWRGHVSGRCESFQAPLAVTMEGGRMEELHEATYERRRATPSNAQVEALHDLDIDSVLTGMPGSSVHSAQCSSAQSPNPPIRFSDFPILVRWWAAARSSALAAPAASPAASRSP